MKIYCDECYGTGMKSDCKQTDKGICFSDGRCTVCKGVGYTKQDVVAVSEVKKHIIAIIDSDTSSPDGWWWRSKLDEMLDSLKNAVVSKTEKEG